jgi:hypothetical protein
MEFYGFHLMVSTVNYKAKKQIDLKSMEVTLQTLESQGKKNMIVKQEDFEGIITDLNPVLSRLNENTNSRERNILCCIV